MRIIIVIIALTITITLMIMILIVILIITKTMISITMIGIMNNTIIFGNGVELVGIKEFLRRFVIVRGV